MKHFIIDYIIYPFDLLVSIGETAEQLRDVLYEKLPNDIHEEIELLFGEFEARTVMFSNGATAIKLPELPTQGIIAHESLHAVEFLMNRIGLENVNEAWNYLIQYIVNQINANI